MVAQATLNKTLKSSTEKSSVSNSPVSSPSPIGSQAAKKSPRFNAAGETVAQTEWRPYMHPTEANKLYNEHASRETVPAGRLLTDWTPKTLLRASQVLFAKKTLARKRLPMKLNLTPFKDPDFVYDTTDPLNTLARLNPIPLNKEGMKFIHEYSEGGDYCVLFYGIRHFNIDYDEFVRRVDISRVGDCFRNVLGINTEVLNRDEQNRPTLQVERIAALTQPDYAAFLGKDELDVYKLEALEYGENEVRNWMRTVCSPNTSTVADDGYLAFKRRPDNNGLTIEFVARQEFPLPRVMVMSGVSKVPPVRTYLAHQAYRSFWGTTVDNILSRYQGKAFWIGHGQPPSESL